MHAVSRLQPPGETWEPGAAGGRPLKRQRLEDMPHSHSMDEILDSIGTGHCKVARAQRMASAMCRDGVAPNTIAAFASLACNGGYEDKIERDMHVWLKHLHHLELSPTFISIPLFDPRTCTIKDTQVPVLAPHEVFWALWRKGPLVFCKLLLGDNPDSIILAWWENTLQQPWGATHPALRKPANVHRTFPLLFHYDGAESFTNQEAHIWTMSSEFSTGNVFDSKLLLAVIS